MTEYDMLQDISRDVKTLMVRAATSATEIKHIKLRIEPLDDLVAWRNRWGGAWIAISLVSTLLGMSGTVLGILLVINEFKQ